MIIYTIINTYNDGGIACDHCNTLSFSKKEEALKALKTILISHELVFEDYDFDRLFENMLNNGDPYIFCNGSDEEIFFIHKDEVHDSFSTDLI